MSPEQDEETIKNSEAAVEEARIKAASVRQKLKNKLNDASEEPTANKKPIEKEIVHGSDSDSDDYVTEMEKERRELKKKKA